MYIFSFFIIVFFLGCFEALGQDITAEELPNIIVMTFSGVRNMDSIEDPTHQYIPNLWNRLFKEGVLYTNFLNVNEQFHMNSIYAIDTGIVHPFFRFSLVAPSFFQYARKKYNLPAYKLWSIGHWLRSIYVLKTENYPEDTFPCALSSLGSNISPELKDIFTKQESRFWRPYTEMLEKNPERWPNWDTFGKIQHRLLMKILQKFKPKLVRYILNDVECAHSDTYSRYVIALKDCDERIFEIWKFIREDPFYKDKTYLIVNVDGNRDPYYRDHIENQYVNPARVWMYIYGPGVKKGVTIERPVYNIDIFATIVAIMDLETHHTEGKPLNDCFYNGKIPSFKKK